MTRASLLIAAILWAVSPTDVCRAQDREPNARAERLDDVGDPLPDGAIRRFGTLRFHAPEGVHELEISPDNRFIATMGQRLILWEAATGRQCWTAVPEDPVHSNVGYGKRRFTFSPDSRRIYLVADSRSIQMLDVESGKRESLRLTGPANVPVDDDPEVDSIDISSNEGLFALGSPQSVIVSDRQGRILYELKNNREVEAPADDVKDDRLQPDNGYAFAKFSPDASLLAAATSDRPKEIRLYSAETGEALRRLPLLARPVQFAFSKDGLQIAVSERDHAVRLYETQTGARVWEHKIELNNPYENYTSSITYSTDGKFIAVGATDNRIYVIEARSGARRGSLVGHGWYPWGIAFSSDSRTLYSSGWEGRIRRWDVATLKQLPLPKGIAGTSVISISADGRTIAYFDDSSTVHLVDRETGREIRQLIGGDTDYSRLQFSPDGRQIATGGSRGQEVVVQLWNVSDGTLDRQWTWPKGRDPHSHVEDLSFRPDGKRLASAVFRQSAVQIWNLETGERVADLKHPEVYGLCYSPDGKTLATAGWDCKVQLWDADSLAQKETIDAKTLVDPGDEELRIYTVRFNPTGQSLAILHLQGMVRIFDVATRKQLRQFKSNGRPYFGALAYSPDGHQLATGLSDGEIAIWNSHTGELLSNNCRHSNTVYTLEFGGDSNTLVSGGNDGVGYLWDVRPPADRK